MSRFRPAVERLDPYVPGEQPPDDAAVVKLNTNENPYPPSPRALEAIRTADPDALRLYPQPMADDFRRAAGEAHGVDPDWILAGNGSDDLLTMLFRAVTGPGRPVAYATPTYVLYRTLAAMQEAPVLEARHALSESLEDTLFALAILGDDRAVRATYIAGRRVWST